MERILEPELLTDPIRARTYAEANYQTSHSEFVDQLKDALRRSSAASLQGYVLEPGCGAADITWRLHEAFPDIKIDAVDGSEAMLGHARQRLAEHGANGRIRLVLGKVPQAQPPRSEYDAIVCNSLLHHLPAPMGLWSFIRNFGRAGTFVFVRDLVRPASSERARELVDMHMAGQPKPVQDDLYESLLSAFELDEVREQLRTTGLDTLDARMVSDRHMAVSGLLR